MENIHATSVDIKGAGILIVGPSGSGKSDLALRLIENKGAVLVADDRTDLQTENGALIASPSKNIEGLLEVRGVGIVKKNFKPRTVVRLALIAKERAEVERLPAKTFFENQKILVPSMELCFLDASAADKVVVKLKCVLEEAKQKT